MPNPSLVVITDVPISQDSAGRYCLNDLHKASGGEKRHGPSYWLETQQTQELIEELSNSLILSDTGNPVTEKIKNLAPVNMVRSMTEKQGTFVVKELVYAYAMWISPKFHIRVIRAFDALVTGNTAQAEAIAREGMRPTDYDGIEHISTAQYHRLRDLVRRMEMSMHHSGGVNHAAWSAARRTFGLKSSIAELPAARFEEAFHFFVEIERLCFEFKTRVMAAEKEFFRHVLRGSSDFDPDSLEETLREESAALAAQRTLALFRLQ